MFIEQPAKWLRWLYPKAIWRMDKNDHSVYLTFDDGPIPESTPFILETLRKYNIKLPSSWWAKTYCATTISTTRL